MKSRSIFIRELKRLRLSLGLSCVALLILAVAGLFAGPTASSGRVRASQDFSPAAGDTCASATVISPGSLPFVEDSTLAGAGNDINPGTIGCAPGGGNDVVYSFTPAATDTYSIGVTPLSPFDASLYIVTDCANPQGTCVAG